MSTSVSTIAVEGREAPRAADLAAVAFALALGLFVLFITGFAEPGALHDIAHDGRHSLAFPCH